MISGELRLRGYDVLTTMEPGGTPLGRRLREAFLETEENVSPLAELLLFAADRAQHVNHLIRPSLDAGRIVISDRYSDATFAYQGAGRGFPEETVNEVIKIATDGLKPDLTLFFDISVDTATARLEARSNSEAVKNRMDAENSAFYERVRNAYLKLAETEKERFRIVDANGSMGEVKAKVLEILTEFLRNG